MRGIARDQGQVIRLKKLLAKVETTHDGSPELDREIAIAFPCAPPKVSRSIDVVIKVIEEELPGWWWTCGFCKLSNDASLYPPGSHKFAHASFGPDGRSGPEALRLLYDKRWGKLFNRGFHRDRHGGSVPLSMLSVFLQAKIALAEAAFSNDPEQKLTEERKAVRAHKRALIKARRLLQQG
jgi:hypothetical protein